MSFIASLLFTLVAILVYLNSAKLPTQQSRLAVRGIALLIGVIAALSAVFKSLIIIPAGEVGVIEYFGKIAQRPLNPGVHLVNPLSDVVTFSTRLTDLKETVEATSQEGLGFNLDVSLQYRLDPSKAPEVYETLGTDETDIVISQFRSIIREITASYPAEAIYSSKRQEVALKLRQRLGEQLVPRGVIIEDTLLREVQLPETFQASIEEKLKAEQESKQMTFKLETERQEAERKRIEAQGQSDAQQILSQGLDEQILQLRKIEAMESLANSSSTKVVVIGSESGELSLNLPTK